jgi:hypothetical protein
MTNDHAHTSKIEDRLKQWHSQMGDVSKTQIRSLTRYVKVYFYNRPFIFLTFFYRMLRVGQEVL